MNSAGEPCSTVASSRRARRGAARARTPESTSTVCLRGQAASRQPRPNAWEAGTTRAVRVAGVSAEHVRPARAPAAASGSWVDQRPLGDPGACRTCRGSPRSRGRAARAAAPPPRAATAPPPRPRVDEQAATQRRHPAAGARAARPRTSSRGARHARRPPRSASSRIRASSYSRSRALNGTQPRRRARRRTWRPPAPGRSAPSTAMRGSPAADQAVDGCSRHALRGRRRTRRTSAAKVSARERRAVRVRVQ